MTETGVTVGIEEEFLLTDAAGTPVPRAHAVLDCVPPLSAVAVKPELQPVQVEACTPPRVTLAEAHEDLCTARAALAAAGAECGVFLLPVGAPPLRRDATTDTADTADTAADRHARVHERYRGLVRDYDACGLHVHVGVPDRDLAVAVVNHLCPWLPTLLALGANSPFHDGLDSGYASWRAVEQSRFPGWGLPPYLRSAREYDETIARLVECGTLVDERQSFWLARPSPRFPTVEVRAADVGLDVGDAVLQGALTRGLVRAALRDLTAGVEAPPIDPQVGAAALWSAARYGLSGPGVDPVRGVPLPATDLVDALLVRISPDLDETCDRAATTDLLESVVRRGGGAGRQRLAGLSAVVAEFALRP